MMYEKPQEHWYNLQLMNKKIGFVHSYFEKAIYNNQEMLRIKTDINMELSGLGKKFTIESNRIEYLDSQLRPRYFFSTSNESGEKHIQGKIIDDIAYISTTLNGKTTEVEVEIPNETISETAAVEYLLAKNKLKVGEKLDYHTFSFDLLKPVRSKLNVIGKEKLNFQSQVLDVFLIETQLDILGGINTRIWITEDGITYKNSTDMMGLAMVATKTSKTTAIGNTDEIDIMLQSRIVPTGKRATTGASSLVAELKLTNGNIIDLIVDNHRQSFELTDERGGVLSIQVTGIDEKDCLNLPIQDSAFSEFLTPSTYIESDNEQIKNSAELVINGEVNSWRAAKKLSKWVYKTITDKNLSGGYSTSLRTLETKSGDCTEHTVLLIALARSVGIPSRICTGLIYSGGGYYYHFWPEVYVGRWVQMDPSIGQEIADANHIQLGGSILESNTMIEFVEGSFRTMNRLEINIRE
ncbi:hypothetical protein JT359_13545 [Candidatus Poribacteria bacterium]|nr:hypothetical protein [Candidatus Poribacteria bacterium]